MSATRAISAFWKTHSCKVIPNWTWISNARCYVGNTRKASTLSQFHDPQIFILPDRNIKTSQPPLLKKPYTSQKPKKGYYCLVEINIPHCYNQSTITINQCFVQFPTVTGYANASSVFVQEVFQAESFPIIFKDPVKVNKFVWPLWKAIILTQIYMIY